MNLFRAYADLIVPTQCLGCGQWDVSLCPACESLVHRRVGGWGLLEGEEGKEDLPVWSLGEYDGVLRRILLAAKHRDRADGDAFVWKAGRTLGLSMSASAALGHVKELWVVPAPSRWRRRWRGREVALMLAHGVAQGIYEGRGGRVRLVQACALRWGGGSQAGRSGGERRQGRVGTMYARMWIPSDVGVVLVDDVVTTGATIREMWRVLGESVVGVGALCHVVR